MAAPKAPLLDGGGKAAKQVTLEAEIFGAEVKPHLVHETVRAELNARRAGTRGAKSRGLVAGGLAFPPGPRSFDVKVNRKARRAALRGALAAHAAGGTFGVLADDAFGEPSTKSAASLLAGWGKDLPAVVVATPEQEAIAKSFRNLDRVAVTSPGELEVAALVWARSLLVTEAALPLVQGRAS
jgi:large subunit ribosomal protein L4